MKRFLLFLCVLQLVCSRLAAQGDAIKFERILPKHGLSHGTVNCILQDREGYMWFGTGGGLNRYDGYNFKVYEHDPNDSTTISDNYIRSIHEDRSGALWIATANGLNKYNKATNTFTLYKHNATDPHSISDNDIRCIYESHLGTLWIGTKLGLNKYDRKTHIFTLYEHSPKHNQAWANNAINTIYEDHLGALWLGTNRGLSSFDPNTSSFTRYVHYTQTSDSLTFKGSVVAIIEDRSGTLWIGTAGDGLKQFDRHTKTFKAYKHDPTNKYSIGNNIILSLFADSFGIIWIGTQTAGLDRFDQSTGKFTHHLYDAKTDDTISDNSIISIHEDRSKVIWIGTFTGGVNKVDLLKKKIELYQHDAEVTNTLRSNFVYSLYTDHSQVIYIGNPMGIDKLDRKTDTYTHYNYTAKLPEDLSRNTAHCIFEDKLGYIWIGLSGGGLQRFDPITKKFTSYTSNPNDPGSLPHSNVNAIHEDKIGNLWIGTRGGLTKLDRTKEKFITYQPPFIQKQITVEYMLEDTSGELWLATDVNGLIKFNPEKATFAQYPVIIKGSEALGNNTVSYIHQDRKGALWVSLNGGGLYTFDPKTVTYRPVTTPAALSKIAINGILEDEQGNLWLSTRKNGLYKFNPHTKALRNYDVYDGLQANEFNRALYKGSDGVMYFGGNNGFNVLHPDSVRDNPYPPQVAISTFKVFDQPREVASQEIELPYSDNFFSFDFVALSYALPEKNQYAYKLDELDKDWIQAGSRRYAPYTNLDPGEYLFRVKAANHDGVWNTQGTTIKIIITPPWWKTTWAYIAYSCIGLALLYGFRRYTVKRERIKHELKLQRLEADKLHELEQMRAKFFTNISHEFRTPLTLIISPLEKMLSTDLQEKQRKEYYRFMYKNAKRLLQLINQLLDVSKLEAGSMKLETTAGDIVAFIKGHLYSFTSLAESHHIKLEFYAQPQAIWAHFDKDKVEKIVNNVVSNAFKFTPEHGQISVRLAVRPVEGHPQHRQCVELEIEDSGIGMSPDSVEKIFDRYYQIDSCYSHELEGTGIGLSLTKELVDLHGGHIHVTSQLGKGTCFTLQLPMQVMPQTEQISSEAMEALLDKEHATFKHVSNHPDVPVVDTFFSGQEKDGFSPLEQQAPLLLLVEDNADVRAYLRSTFEQSYQILEAKEGREGLALAIEHIPDLIISDWMMPEMDGVELCAQVKRDERTSHIPFILLTAKSTVESKLKGLQTGADDYLIKPFHTDELLARVNNMIAQRNKVRERFKYELALQAPAATPTSIPRLPASATLSPTDEKFIEKLIGIIEVNVSDTDFSIEQLEREIGMSHGQLYRKLKAVVDQSPGEFLRDYRLKKAAVLLSKRDGNVSQVAYEVGFNNLSYFTKCFRQRYGVTPSEFSGTATQVSQS